MIIQKKPNNWNSRLDEFSFEVSSYVLLLVKTFLRVELAIKVRQETPRHGAGTTRKAAVA